MMEGRKVENTTFLKGDCCSDVKRTGWFKALYPGSRLLNGRWIDSLQSYQHVDTTTNTTTTTIVV